MGSTTGLGSTTIAWNCYCIIKNASIKGFKQLFGLKLDSEIKSVDLSA